MKGIFSVLVENRDGVLSQIAGLFARRGFNIDSLAVSSGDSRTLDQVEKHLNKKIDVIKVRRLEESSSILKEMMLIKVAHSVTTRASLIELCSVTDAKVVHFSQKTMVIQLTAEPEAILNFIELVRNYGILEIQRTGSICVSKD